MFGYRKASADIDPCKEFITLSQRWIRLHAVSPPTLRMTDTDPLLCKRSSRVCLTQHKSELTFSVTAKVPLQECVQQRSVSDGNCQNLSRLPAQALETLEPQRGLAALCLLWVKVELLCPEQL